MLILHLGLIYNLILKVLCCIAFFLYFIIDSLCVSGLGFDWYIGEKETVNKITYYFAAKLLAFL